MDDDFTVGLVEEETVKAFVTVEKTRSAMVQQSSFVFLVDAMVVNVFLNIYTALRSAFEMGRYGVIVPVVPPN